MDGARGSDLTSLPLDTLRASPPNVVVHALCIEPANKPPLPLELRRQASLHRLKDANPKGEEVELTFFWFSRTYGRVIRDATSTV